MAEGAQDGNQGSGGGLRWLVMTALVLAAIFGGRRWALRRADAEFEQRLMEADRSRN
jgi:hypothetical protein